MADPQRDEAGRKARPTLLALCFGNFVIGTGIQAPAGMMAELSQDFAMSVSAIGSLIWIGALMVAIGAPLLAWTTTRIDRRLLLGVALCGCVLSHLVALLSSSFWLLVLARIVVTLGAGTFTPQAAAVAGMLVPQNRRVQAVSLVFLGWSLAAVGATPTVKLIAAHLGWREAMGVLCAGTALAAWLIWRMVPAGLSGVPISLATWGTLARRPAVLLTLLITTLSMAGIQALGAYIVPFLDHALSAGASLTALLMALQGAAGLAGATIASRYGGRIGVGPGVGFATGAMGSGMLVLGLSGGSLLLAVPGMLLFGSGIFASNSLQQARLIALEPAMASASVALNSSVVHAGMGLGAYLGGLVIAADVGMVPFNAALLMSLAFLLSLAMLRVPRSE